MKRDPAWKHATEVIVPGDGEKKPYKYVKCNYCSNTITEGIKRMKDHLAGTHVNTAPCSSVTDEVKNEMKNYLNSFKEMKHMAQRKFQESVDGISYFGGGSASGRSSECVDFCQSTDRGNRGTIDRYLTNVNVDVDDENDGRVKETPKLTPTLVKEHRNQVCLDIGRFFYENGISFNCATSPSYINMLWVVGNYGRGLKAPTMLELRHWILDEEEKTTSESVEEIKQTWKKTGVSILSDGWSDMRNRSLINFLVNNQHGTVFLKTIDASDCVKSAKKLFELLDDVVEEVGEELVVQVVTDNATAYKLAGKMLMDKRPTLYWTPCAAHCIDLILEKICELPQHKSALTKAKCVSTFIHNHQWVLSLFRKFAKKYLVRPAATRFATAFLTLESMLELKQPLQMMFISNEWSDCAWTKKEDGKAVKKIVMSDNIFWPSVIYSIKTTKPLVHVLRIVDGESMPAMGFLYGAMDEAKETKAKSFNGEVSNYKEIWNIIDQKWDNQLHRDLHATAYYLNPRFRYSDNVSEHPEIITGLYKCMERLIRDPATFSKIDKQIDAYKYKQGLFGFRAALSSYMTRSPVAWWDNFGDEVPELKAFAMKILGLTCSASECERNWSTFNQVHTKRINCLTTVRLNKLVYIMYNRRLMYKHLKKQSRKDEDDPLVFEDMPSDDEWVVNSSDGEDDGAARTFQIEEDHAGESSNPSRKRKKN